MAVPMALSGGWLDSNPRSRDQWSSVLAPLLYRRSGDVRQERNLEAARFFDRSGHNVIKLFTSVNYEFS